MYDFNDIETMLREKRATPEEIAKAFTDSLNAAIVATAEPTEWEKGIADLVDDWNYMIDLYIDEHPEETKDWDLPTLYVTSETMESLIQASIDAYKMADSIVNNLDKFASYAKKHEANSEEGFRKAMRDFFKEIGV